MHDPVMMYGAPGWRDKQRGSLEDLARQAEKNRQKNLDKRMSADDPLTESDIRKIIQQELAEATSPIQLPELARSKVLRLVDAINTHAEWYFDGDDAERFLSPDTFATFQFIRQKLVAIEKILQL